MYHNFEKKCGVKCKIVQLLWKKVVHHWLGLPYGDVLQFKPTIREHYSCVSSNFLKLTFEFLYVGHHFLYQSPHGNNIS
jgi:hypothetical protein